MFQCGDQVLYCSHGVCKIVDIETKKISGKTVEYFVLEPVEQKQSKFYIPTQNQTAVAKLQPLLTQPEVEHLLQSVDISDVVWIQDENKRKQQYASLIISGNRTELVKMAQAIGVHKAQQESAGKKLHQCDELFLRDAQKLLGAEISMVLNISVEEVGKYVQSIFNAQQKGYFPNERIRNRCQVL